jgi:hypothetical protein
MEFINRIGVFFLWIGALNLLLFFFSSIAETANMNLLIAGFLLIVFGAMLWLKNPTEKPKSNRFRLIRSRQSKNKTNTPPKPSNKDAATPRSAQKK